MIQENVKFVRKKLFGGFKVIRHNYDLSKNYIFNYYLKKNKKIFE